MCDSCNEKLESSYAFRQQCVVIYQKLNPSSVYEAFEIQEENNEPTSISEASKNDSNTAEAITEDPEDYQIVTISNEGVIIEAVVEDDYDNTYVEYKEETEEDEPAEDPESKTSLKSSNEERVIMSRKSYTVEDKLKIVEFAEENNNRAAAREFSLNESTVRCFRRQKQMLLKMNPQQKTNRKAYPHWPQLEQELKKFVINHPLEHGAKAKLREIKEEAINIAAKHGIENFNGSNSYIFKFMLRQNLQVASPKPRKNKKLLLKVEK